MAGRPLSSVQSAARVLCTFTAAERELGVSELSRRLGLKLYELGIVARSPAEPPT